MHIDLVESSASTGNVVDGEGESSSPLLSSPSPLLSSPLRSDKIRSDPIRSPKSQVTHADYDKDLILIEEGTANFDVQTKI
jgi:hypothetical protein